MNISEVRPLKHDVRKIMRWAVLILPVFFCGCFDTQSTARQTAQRKSSGISSLSRFFTYGQEDTTTKPAEAGAVPASFVFSGGISTAPELAEDASENRIAIPSFIGAEQSVPVSNVRTGAASRNSFSSSGRERASSFQSAVSLVFNSPFSLMFSKVFKQTKSNEPIQVAKDEMPNPFTEARLQQQSTTANEDSNAKGSDVKADVIAKEDPTNQTASKDSKPEDSSKPGPTNSITPVPPTGLFSGGGFLVIGDFDGSGILRAASAQRSSDTRFVTEDGEREFNLYINSAAVEQERAFYVDDINMDGNPDILVTSMTALFGGILFGDSAGGYHLAGTFVKGYESTVPCAGPIRNGMREIVAISVQTGLMRTFQYTDKYHLLQTERLSFVPDYLLHLVAPDSSREFVMAGQAGGTEQILGWRDDGVLKPTAEQLGADSVVLNSDFGSMSVLAHQVGNYASIVLTSQGQSFNVANMRLTPRTYLVIGDINRRGNLDVAVADLESYIPSQNRR